MFYCKTSRLPSFFGGRDFFAAHGLVFGLIFLFLRFFIILLLLFILQIAWMFPLSLLRESGKERFLGTTAPCSTKDTAKSCNCSFLRSFAGFHIQKSARLAGDGSDLSGFAAADRWIIPVLCSPYGREQRFCPFYVRHAAMYTHFSRRSCFICGAVLSVGNISIHISRQTNPICGSSLSVGEISLTHSRRTRPVFRSSLSFGEILSSHRHRTSAEPFFKVEHTLQISSNPT